MQTGISSVRGNIAKGFILNDDLSTTDCYILKHEDIFAHGENLRKAQQALQDKMLEEMPIDKRIDLFLENFNVVDKYPVMMFFDWHHKLTGSCEIGRKTFAKNRGIDLENDIITVGDFIELTINDYGSEVIRKLKERICQDGIK